MRIKTKVCSVCSDGEYSHFPVLSFSWGKGIFAMIILGFAIGFHKK